ncbi:MAG: pseudaminic acid cytidylyltransferase [Burkholderiales bacterium]|nr:pseudaminic acid cytidylyltransferase [Burkholderiales bacterium]
MRLAVIPARGGSKRIPRKNVRLFHGKPMIAYAIATAQASGLFDDVLVSTDDAEIAEVAREHGALTPFTRPSELADDQTPTVPVIAHAITAVRRLGLRVEQVCCIYPGVPLLLPGTIAQALELLGPAHYVFPVIPFPSPIQRALRRDASGRTTPFHPECAETRTQDLEPAFHDAGQFYWGEAQTWVEGKSLHGNAVSIVLPASRAIDIDTPADWEHAEALYQALRTGVTS